MSGNNFMEDSSPIMEAIKADAAAKAPEVKTENTEEKKEDVLTHTETEIKTEEKSTETQETKATDTQTEVEFDVNSFNRKFNTEYKTADEINALFESPKQLEELRTSLLEKEKAIQEKDELLNKQTDGLKLFANEKMYKINHIMLNNSNITETAATKLVSADLDNMKDEDVLVLKELIDAGGNINEEIVKFSINQDYNLNVDKGELEGDELKQYQANEYRRQRDAKKAKDELKKLIDIKVPERIDLLEMEKTTKQQAEQKFAQSLESWKTKSKEVIDGLGKYVIEYDKGEKFEFDYGDEFKSYLTQNLPEFAARLGYDANDKESIKKLAVAIDNDFRNRTEIQRFKAFKEHLLAQWNDKAYREKHNIPDPKTTEAPDVLSDVEKKNQAANEKIAASLKQNYF